MKLDLFRGESDAECTLGDLEIDEIFECYTLEDPVRPDPKPETKIHEGKIYGRTAIPAGTYELVKHKSPKFGWVLMLLRVPSYDLVYLHNGNKASHTLGCILVGQTKGSDEIGQSKLARAALEAKVFPLLERGEKVFIEIHDF
jgi:hypothetical protein